MSDYISDLILLLRISIVGLSIFTAILWIKYYFVNKQPLAIAIVTWLANLVAFNIYRFIAVGHFVGVHTAPIHAEVSGIIDTWSAALHIHALVLLIAAYYLFLGKKKV